jgi:hypothetical protein
VVGGLRGVGIWIGVVALVAALTAYLFGRPAWFRRLAAALGEATASKPGGSDLEVWAVTHAGAVRIGATALAVLVLFFTGIDWVPVALVVLALGLGLWGVAIAEQRVHSTGAP